jgi:hypothetical protein
MNAMPNETHELVIYHTFSFCREETMTQYLYPIEHLSFYVTMSVVQGSTEEKSFRYIQNVASELPFLYGYIHIKREVSLPHPVPAIATESFLLMLLYLSVSLHQPQHVQYGEPTIHKYSQRIDFEHFIV